MKTLGLVLYCAVLISLTGVWGALELNFPGKPHPSKLTLNIPAEGSTARVLFRVCRVA